MNKFRPFHSGQAGAILLSACLSLPSAHLLAQQLDGTIATAPQSNSTSTQISLEEAITRAKANEPNFAAAVAAAKNAWIDHTLARAALLPGVIYHNQYIYTQPNHAPGQDSNAPPRYISGNSVHEYASQGIASETIGLAGITAVAQASAAASLAKAQLEVTRRGLVSTVVNLYYTALASDQKLIVAQRALDESNDFLLITQRRESARESAHADVIKAQLTQQQSQRDLSDARLAAEKSRLDLAVLLFPDPRTAYSLTPATAPAPLMQRPDAEAAAAHNNPDLQSALATLRGASLDVTAARAAYLPDLSLNYTYGIDSQQFAIHSPDGSRNLGYSASATLDIPVWDWFSTHNRIRQKINLRESAKIALTNTQRTLIAQFDEVYNEAKVAGDQLDSLNTSVTTAEQSLKLTRLRYTAGEASVLDVVDAQTSYTAAQQAEQDGKVRYQTALANLQTLTGTL